MYFFTRLLAAIITTSIFHASLSSYRDLVDRPSDRRSLQDGVLSYRSNRERSSAPGARELRNTHHHKKKNKNKANLAQQHIRFAEGICDGISSWKLSEEFFTDFRNLSTIFPDAIKHCTGDPGFDIPTTMAPPGYCIRGGKSKTCGMYKQCFVEWTNFWSRGYGPWFNQFILENVMLRRWATTMWNSSHPIVIVPSPYMHCEPKLWYDLLSKFDGWKKLDEFWGNTAWEKYFLTLRENFYLPIKKRQPLIVIHISYAWDLIPNLRMLDVLQKLPRDFAARLVIASIEGPNIPARFRRKFALRPRTERPLFVTLPYPVGISDAADFSRASGNYTPSARRPISVYFTGQIRNKMGTRPTRSLIRRTMKIYWPNNHICDKSLPNYPTSRLCLCAPGTKTNVSFCGQDFLQQRDYDMKVNPYAAVVASDFCLEPPGDTPTRSHFYLAVFSGCIPVIFDHECSRKSKQGLDFSNMETSWPWRHTSFRLNYSDFTVVYNSAVRKAGTPKELHKFLQSLVAMPSERPEEFKRLRRGVSRAAKWMRYALEDCHGSRDCDAFNLFKHLLEARAQELEGKNKFPMSEDFVGPGTYVRCRAR